MRWDKIWYSNHPISYLLLPLSWVFCALVALRRLLYRWKILRSYRPPVPVIIVGNITVGGTGKTPLVIWLAQLLKAQGFKPGIISRGYKGKARYYPQAVRADSDPKVVGDEPILLARYTNCPVAVAPQRILAVQALLKYHACDVIISDDGLQHYALQRDIEIAVLDGERRYGNRRCLPAGALREPLSRLKSIDLIVTKGMLGSHEYGMQYESKHLVNLKNSQLTETLNTWRGRSVHAIAGIGHPERFFSRLRDLGLNVQPHIFPDHHAYQAQDLDFRDDYPVIMTEKDAVKCAIFATTQHWYLPITARLPAQFGEKLLQLLDKRNHDGQKTIRNSGVSRH
jgi:tetraacyldisaccharide 4'-kinase